MPSPSSLLTLGEVRDAAEQLRGVAHRTPSLTSRTLDRCVGATVVLKGECFQRTGSFKFRGAYNTLSLMASTSTTPGLEGVCTISSGNHAQALALAARELGVPAVILMPEDAPAAKLAATRGYGAEVVTYDRYSMPQAEAGRRLQEERGLPFVSSHDDPRISAGAGTAALELWDDSGPFDVLVAPVGGGGGLAGYATVAKAMDPGCIVVGVESDQSAVNQRSLAGGHRVRIDIPRTIADGQQLTTPGEYPFAVMRERVDRVETVADAEIVAAMALLFDRLKVVTEPSGAIAVAALLSGRLRDVVAGRRVGVIVTGGNIGTARFAELVSAAGVTRFGEEGRELSYSGYLRLTELLDLQHTRTAAHDELLFIVIHQVYELWFALLLHELEAARDAMVDGNVPRATHNLRRVSEVEEVLIAQVAVLNTMRPQDFLEFRNELAPASGFQSVQFREIEFLSGLKDPAFLDRIETTADERARLERRLAEPTLWDAFLTVLERAGQPSLLEVFRNRDTYGELVELAEALLDHDEGMARWRTRHVQMVERQLGTKSGTGGSTGAAYLRSTEGRHFFPDLWAVRSAL